jgi:hypothetical protein
MRPGLKRRIDDGDGVAATCDSRAEAFLGWPKFLSPSSELAGQAQAQTQTCAVPLFSFGAGADSWRGSAYDRPSALPKRR